LGKLHVGLLNQWRDVAMHVILENQPQAINTAQVFPYKHVAGAAASVKNIDRKVVRLAAIRFGYEDE
jgi:hypothetical protein